METFKKLALIVTLLIHFVNDSETKENNLVQRTNMCTRIVSLRKNYTVPVEIKKKEIHYTWCFRIPPRCKEYRWKTKYENKTVTMNETKIAYDCCKGYERASDNCIPLCRLGCGHGECIEPDVCLCDEGWSEPYCTSECEPNRYGKGCVQNCTCMNGGTCDKKDGSCTCAAGYIGTHCELSCPDNLYGMGCRKKCRCQNGGMCDIKNGKCDCEPGYYGKYCENRCELGSHGKNCKFDCLCLPDTTSTCDHKTGECICRPGYEGEFCEKQCKAFTYGRDCAYDCDCVNAEFCEPENGRCVCELGWTGEKCSETCPAGTFGEDCMYTCEHCANVNATCNHVTGFCECPPGSYGNFCESSCPKGQWGLNCSEICECLENEDCNPITGECTCFPGWKLPYCSESCPSGWFGYNCSFECNCADGNPCTPTTGNCQDTSKAETTQKESYVPGIIGIIVFLAVLVFIITTLIWIYRVEVLRTFASLPEYFSKSGCCKSDEISIAPVNFSNPLYISKRSIERNVSTSGEIAAVDEISHSRSGVESLQEQINTITDLDKKTPSMECSKTADSCEVVTKSYVKKMRESFGEPEKKSDSSNSTAAFENGYTPEVLGDFKIPEVAAYENAVYGCRSVENPYEDIPSKH